MEQPLPPSLAALVPRLTAEASRSLRVAYAALQAERCAAAARSERASFETTEASTFLQRRGCRVPRAAGEAAAEGCTRSGGAAHRLARGEHGALLKSTPPSTHALPRVCSQGAARTDDRPRHREPAAAVGGAARAVGRDTRAKCAPLSNRRSTPLKLLSLLLHHLTCSADALPATVSAVAAKSSSAASAGARAHTPLLERYKSHRRRVERAAGVEAATLLEDRFGPAAWCASLRDNWQLCVPQGHPLLSGLGSVTSVLTPERAEVVHDPRLTIVGRGLEAGLRLLAATQPGPRECAARMAGGDPTAAAQVLEVLDDTAADDAGAPAAAGGGEAASAARPDAAPAAEAASHGEEGAPSPFPPGRGPSLALSPTRLRFDSAGEAQTVTLTNTGSVALYLSWSLADTTRDTRDAWFEPTAPRRALLPGASASLRFTFRPTERGEVKEIWALRCKPALLAGSGGGGAAQLLFEGSAARPCSRAARRGSTAGEPRRGRTTHVTSRAPMSAR